MSFSDVEGEPVNDTLEVTGSDSSPDTSHIAASTRKDNTQSLNSDASGNNKKKKKKKAGKRGGEEKGTRDVNEGHYQLRGRNRH